MLHPNNRHRHGYDLKALCLLHPALKDFIISGKEPSVKPTNDKKTNAKTDAKKDVAIKKNNGNGSINRLIINFSNATAVKALNIALLKQSYQIKYWDIPQGYLCPAIPRRVDYIHYLADLLNETFNCATLVEFNRNTNKDNNTENNNTKDNKNKKVSVLDIGTGAGCIYPILGHSEYNWNFVASDIDPTSIKFANKIIQSNSGLSNAIECRLQPDNKQIFNSIIKDDDFFHLTLCNPPFHKSLADASKGTERKWTNLAKNNSERNKPGTKALNSNNLNFGGQKAELWCPGGEVKFVRDMIKESKGYQKQVLWFTCLISKKDNLSAIKLSLKKTRVAQLKVIKMAQGQKISRFIAWSFLTPEQQHEQLKINCS